MINEIILMIILTGGGDAPVDASLIEVESVTECEERAGRAKAGDLLIIKACISSIGNSSYVSRYEMYNLEDNALSATMEATSVHFDMIKRCSAPLTDEFKKKAIELSDNAENKRT